MIINQENLVKAGYSQFKSGLNQHNDTYLESYQKSIRDDKGIKYFITIDFYDLSKYNDKLRVRFQTGTQFNLNNGFTFNVDGLNNDKITITELEIFYEKIWSDMNCKYYEET